MLTRHGAAVSSPWAARGCTPRCTRGLARATLSCTCRGSHASSRWLPTLTWSTTSGWRRWHWRLTCCGRVGRRRRRRRPHLRGRGRPHLRPRPHLRRRLTWLPAAVSCLRRHWARLPQYWRAPPSTPRRCAPPTARLLLMTSRRMGVLIRRLLLLLLLLLLGVRRMRLPLPRRRACRHRHPRSLTSRWICHSWQRCPRRPLRSLPPQNPPPQSPPPRSLPLQSHCRHRPRSQLQRRSLLRFPHQSQSLQQHHHRHRRRRRLQKLQPCLSLLTRRRQQTTSTRHCRRRRLQLLRHLLPPRCPWSA